MLSPRLSLFFLFWPDLIFGRPASCFYPSSNCLRPFIEQTPLSCQFPKRGYRLVETVTLLHHCGEATPKQPLNPAFYPRSHEHRSLWKISPIFLSNPSLFFSITDLPEVVLKALPPSDHELILQQNLLPKAFISTS